VYLRRTKRKNKDGTVAHYLQLAHNVRDPDTGVVKAKILHSFGRAEHLEREALERLIVSVARYLDQDPPLVTSSASSPAVSGEVEAVDARSLGGAWVLDQLWRRLGIDAAVKKVARGRKFDAARVERVLFALVASRGLAPSSKLEATRWIRQEVHLPGLAEVDHTACYRAMDFLLASLDELQETVFFTVADLLQLEVDLLFFDTTSSYFELELADGELDDEPGFRAYGHSKDHRPDLPQVVIGMAVTRGGIPVRLWCWPGHTSDQTVLGQVKDDLAGWQLNRTVWVVDSGFNSADNRKVLQRGGSGFIVAERLRGDEHDVGRQPLEEREDVAALGGCDEVVRVLDAGLDRLACAQSADRIITQASGELAFRHGGIDRHISPTYESATSARARRRRAIRGASSCRCRWWGRRGWRM
jgi:hypothetical protein